MAAVYASSMEKLYYASRRTGDSVKNLQALRYAGEQFGISGERMQGALDGAARAFRANPFLKDVIAGTLRIPTAGRSPSEILVASLRELRKMPEFMGQQFAADWFGLSSDDYQVMTQNLDGIEAAMKRQLAMQKASGTNVDKIAEAMHDWENGVRDVGMAFKQLQGILAEDMLPVMHWLTNSSKDFLDNIGKAIQSTQGKDFFGKGGRGSALLDAASGFGPLPQPGNNALLAGIAPRDNAELKSMLQAARIALLDASRGAGYAASRGILPITYQSNNNPSGAKPSEAVADPTRPNTLGMRNHNPGNLRPAGASTGFQSFGDDDEGLFAMANQLALYFDRNKDTIRSIVSTWAPGNENNTAAYIASVAKSMGMSPDAHLSRDPGTMSKLMGGMIGVENGRNPFASDRLANAAMSSGLVQNITIVVRDEDAARRIKNELQTLTGNTGRDLTSAVR